MNSKSSQLLELVTSSLEGMFVEAELNPVDEVTVELAPENLIEVATKLRDDPALGFDQLMDVAGVDYAEYGIEDGEPGPLKLAAVYHLLSLQHNWRIRLRVMAPQDLPMLESVCGIWSSATWFEREAFDLFGIIFNGHPDLRRILTDYGFIGHPFRKDFPLIGHVEVFYDAEQGRVAYRPVDIENRITVPKVIREDNRYESAGE